MRTFILTIAAAAALSTTGCVVRERPVAYHHVGPGPHHVAPPARHSYYESHRGDREYMERRDYPYYR
jgi:hypothetical protein